MISAHSTALHLEFEWLSAVIDYRLNEFFAKDTFSTTPDAPVVPELPEDSAYTKAAPSNPTQRMIFALALARIAVPATLDPFLVRNAATNQPFTEFGGLTRKSESGFIPTIETALFLAAGSDSHEQSKIYRELFSDSGLINRQLLHIDDTAPSVHTRELVVPGELVARLFTGYEPETVFSGDFPAQRLHTTLDWDDLVLSEHTLNQINHLRAWLDHEQTLLDDWGFRKALATGYRALFHGPPGTGKTLSAALLGKATGRPVYRIDLSMVVSPYIGETEKNLARVFDRASIDHRILFFDEADALLGERTQTTSSNDRYANQEISYLLQRIEEYTGLTILATNLPGNINAAFSRRFQLMVTFAQSNQQKHLSVWSEVVD